MRTKIGVAIALTLLLSACKTGGSPAVQVAPKAKPQQQRQVTEGSIAGDYVVYNDGVIGNGESSVLFFYAAWCPYCQEKEKNLIEWYSTAEFPMKTYRVDFDTEQALKKRYGITQQDSFVLIDGTGKAIATEISPSLTKLKRLLYANIEAAKSM